MEGTDTNIKDRQKQLILNGELKKVLWKLSLPAIAAMVLYGLNVFLDTVFVGQLLNEQALAAVALAYPLTSIMLGFGALVGTGASSILSIAIGANDTGTQQKLLGNITFLILISTVVFAVPSYIYAEPLIKMMGARGEILRLGVEYFSVTLIGALFWVYGLVLNFIIRGEGKMKEAAVMMSFGLIVNVILNPVFISVFNMGVAGAAWATNIGMLVYSIVGYVYFVRGKASFSANINSISYDKHIFRSVLAQGMPAFIMSLMSLLQAIVVFNALNSYGTDKDLAFFAAANRIQLFLMTPLFGLMRALQPVAGINFGAKQYDKVKRSFILFTKAGFYIIFPFWLILTIFPASCLLLVLPDMSFTSTDLLNFRIYMLILPLLPVIFMGMTFFPAINQGRYGSIIGIARQIVFYIPAMMLLPRFLNTNWVYYGSTIIDAIIVLWALAIIRGIFRKLSLYKPRANEAQIIDAHLRSGNIGG